MLKYFGIAAAVLAVGVAGLFGVAATKPDTFSVKRTATIQAPPAAIMAQLQDFKAWKNWSPYDKLDPAMKRTYGGADQGVGATYAWDGNDDAGAGDMKITKAEPTQLALALHFTRPFEGTNETTFTLEPNGDATTVTWDMHGPQPIVARVMCLFMDMDKLVGGDFEKGLANIKAIAEKRG